MTIADRPETSPLERLRQMREASLEGGGEKRVQAQHAGVGAPGLLDAGHDDGDVVQLADERADGFGGLAHSRNSGGW